MKSNDKAKVVVIGAGGHAKVVIDVLRQSDIDIIGIVDPKLRKGELFAGVNVLGDDTILDDFSPEGVRLANGIGSMPGLATRWDIQDNFGKKGFRFTNVIHKSAIVSSDVVLAEGVQIMAGVVIQPGVSIGKGSIINTSSSIDHDCTIGANCHIAPGVTMSGEVKVQENTHIGTGASVIQGVTIGKNCIVGAGSVVFKSLADDMKFIQLREQVSK